MNLTSVILRTKTLLAHRKLSLLLLIAAFLFVAAGAVIRQERDYKTFVSTFTDTVAQTDRVLLEFGEVDERYIRGLASDAEYGMAWDKLKTDLDRINTSKDSLQNPPKKLRRIVGVYELGLAQVITAVNDVTQYLHGQNNDASIIMRDREIYVRGLNLLREVKKQLTPVEGSI